MVLYCPNPNFLLRRSTTLTALGTLALSPTMSGFEVAGIILGALPILIQTIEHIPKSLSTKRYDQQLQA